MFRKNADGSITFTLPQGNIGDFVLPQITGSIPSNLKGQVVPQPIPVGRKLLAAQWWQVTLPLFICLPQDTLSPCASALKEGSDCNHDCPLSP